MNFAYYYINDKFIWDNGIPDGVNIMLFKGDDPGYWFAEIKCETVAAAYRKLQEYGVINKVSLIEKEIKHPIPNRNYTTEEILAFENS